MIDFISGNGEKISVLEFKLKRIKIQEARKFITEYKASNRLQKINQWNLCISRIIYTIHARTIL